ncbi:MAG: type VI secretion system baseplate subunit TssF [Nannocystaceae bacterium]|nr:type VI secretion system baseplate subunit TssF [Myxococcales bacterium]
MFSKYYQGELAFLRELGGEFARAHPATAGLLSERSGDPDVERLLQGVAFLTAQLKERVDDAHPRFIHDLAALLLPHSLRPVPAATIIEFKPRKPPKERLTLERGAELSSRPVRGARCLFQTSADVDLLPLRIARAELEEQGHDAYRLRLGFESTGSSATAAFHARGIRLFLHAGLPTAACLLTWLMRHCRGVTIRSSRAGGKRVALPPDVLAFPGLTPDEPLLPWPEFAPSGLRIVQEYFTLPEKLLFVDIKGLDAARDSIESRFEVEFEIRDAPGLPTRLSAEMFRINCAPAINLFAVSAEPIRRDPLVREHLVRASGLTREAFEVFDVREVIGVQAGDARRRQYSPFLSFAHDAPGAEQTYYDLRRSTSPIDGAVDTYIGVERPRDLPPGVGKEVLSVELLCTNRDLPTELDIGDISTPTPRSRATATFSNITPVSRPARPPLDGSLHWRVLGHLAAQRRSLADPGVLAAMLGFYNVHADADVQRGRANQRRVEAIRDVSMRPVTRLVSSLPVRGTETIISVNETGFAGVGDAFLFGCVLDEVIAALVPLNSFNQLRLMIHPAQREYTWRPRNGARTLF